MTASPVQVPERQYGGSKSDEWRKIEQQKGGYPTRFELACPLLHLYEVSLCYSRYTTRGDASSLVR